MQYEDLTDIAERMLRASPEDIAEARRNAARGNSLIGGVLAGTYCLPREITEAAVREALRRIGERECEGCGG